MFEMVRNLFGKSKPAHEMSMLINYYKPESEEFAKHMTNMFIATGYDVICSKGIPAKSQIKSSDRIFLIDFGIQHDENHLDLKTYRHMYGRPLYLIQQEYYQWDKNFLGLQKLADNLKIMAVLAHTEDKTNPLGKFKEFHYPYEESPYYEGANPSVVMYSGNLPEVFQTINPDLQFRNDLGSKFLEATYYLHHEELLPSLYTYTMLKAIKNSKLPVFSEEVADKTPIRGSEYSSRCVIKRKELDIDFYTKIDDNHEFINENNTYVKVYNSIRDVLKNVE
mgnify:CR=1 FL=1